MAIYSSTVLNGSQTSTGLGGNYATQGTLATFNFPVNGTTVETHVEVDSGGGRNAVTLNGPDGRPLAHYTASTNTWTIEQSLSGSQVPQTIVNKINSTPGLANALSQSAYFTTLNKTGNATQATNITGITPTTPTPPPVAPPPSPRQAPTGGGIGVLSNPLDAFAGITSAITSGDRLLQSFPLLKYPENILENQQDTLVITQFRYNPPNADIFRPGANTTTNIFQSGLTSNTAITEQLVKIILPAPNNAADSNNVGWGPDNMNNLTAAAASGVLSNLGGTVAGGGIGGAIATLIAALTGSNLTSAAAQGASLGIKAAVYAQLLDQAKNQPNANAILGSALGSQSLNMAGFEVSPESILARGAGIIPNSNLELLFNAPTLREFRFDYRLSPRSKEEAEIVRKIIRSFKQGMAPRKVNAGSSSGPGGYFLATPNVFKLEYKHNNTDLISGINRFKICALTGFTVNYTPDGQWAAYDEGQPVSYMMSMSFGELEPIYEGDYMNKNNVNELATINPGDVGY